MMTTSGGEGGTLVHFHDDHFWGGGGGGTLVHFCDDHFRDDHFCDDHFRDDHFWGGKGGTWSTSMMTTSMMTTSGGGYPGQLP